VLMDFWSLGLFFRAHTTFNPIHPERTQALVTQGPYRYTRNPMYVGMLIILLGWSIWLGSISPFLLLPLFVWVLTKQQIIPEEKILEQTFGDAYLAYKRRVSRWLW
ncbi:MAG: isoprenylcysteine carboxylmethyltransferase family protein, partial [Thiothrix litoralis]